MSDKVLFEELNPNGESEVSNETPPKTKKERKKKEYTEEQKEAMRLRLAKGRETALANRRKKALAKKIDKQKEEDELDQKIAMDIQNKDNTNKLKQQVADLKAELAELKETRKEVKVEIKEEKVAEVKAEKKNELAEINEKMALMAKVIDTLLAEKRKKAEPKAEPVKEPEPVKVPEPVKNVVFDAMSYNKRGKFL